MLLFLHFNLETAGLKMSKVRNQFTAEFKQECINLVVNQGYGIAQAASAMQVGLSAM